MTMEAPVFPSSLTTPEHETATLLSPAAPRDDPANSMDASLLIQQIAEAVIAVVSIAGNALVLYVIAKHTSLHTVTNYLIGSLAMADLLVGAIGLPAVMVNIMGLPNDFYGCLFMSCVIVVLTQVSIFSLLLIALERCVAVKYPILHRQHAKGSTHVTVAIVMSWVLGTVVGLVPMFGWHAPRRRHPPDADDQFVCAFLDVMDMDYMVYFNFMGCVLMPIVIMFITYGYIYYVVKTRCQKPSMKNRRPSDIEGPRKLSRESKASLRIFLVLVFFTISWLPIHIINTVFVLTGGLTNPHVMLVGILLSHANSAMNPFLYALTNRKYSAAFRVALGFKKSGLHNGDIITQADG